MLRSVIVIIICFAFISFFGNAQKLPEMYFTEHGPSGHAIAKDPYLVKFKNAYFMYYSIPGKNMQNWFIGIATSTDLVKWKKIGELTASEPYEAKGICAPGGIVRNDTLHLFYQTYGNGKKDAICHATTVNGLDFIKDETNPVFRPDAFWTCGRAIDAEVVYFQNKYYLYFATRDTAYKIQQQGVAVTSRTSNFAKGGWRLLSTDSAILRPALPWETHCLEGASCVQVGKHLYMFYAGGYNNDPQQIGVARSTDGLHWKRVNSEPFLKNGKPGEWNESESGHPGVFKDTNNKFYLFFQGNNDKGNSWYISKKEIGWTKNGPYLKN